MNLAVWDWLIVAVYLGFSLFLGLYFSKRGTRNVNEFFVSGRNLPWWLAGVTMAASAFAIDTPLGIVGLVSKHGIPGMWYAWSFVIGGAGALGAFVFAPLLRRSEVITTAELVELRYSGRAARFLRGFKGVYFGIFANAITIGWVIKAVFTITKDVLGLNPHLTLAALLLFTLAYTAVSGLWGIVATDFVQFIIGLFGIYILAVLAWRHIGGLEPLLDGLAQRYGAAEAAERLRFIPSMDSSFFIIFIVFVSLKWWGNPPPAIHQRIVASKNARHASLSTLFFAITAFAINYWPMIIIALVSLAAFPSLEAPEHGYGMLMLRLLPTGLLGLMVASMVAAFMSTIDTHINYGAAYMVNDIYRRFIRRHASEKHYVRAAQCSTVIMLLIAVGIAYSLDSVQQAWYYMATLTAGYGFIIVLRWFWWRINAWSEIAALAASGVGSTLLASRFAKLLGYYPYIEGLGYGRRFLIILSASTIAWVLVTLLGHPSDEDVLVTFCRKVKPFRQGWGPIYRKYPRLGWNMHLGRSVVHWLLGTIGIFSICFGIGNILLASTSLGIALLAVAAVIFFGIYLTWDTRGEL